MLQTVVQLNIFVETVMYIFSGFFDEYKVQKNSIYLKYKYFVTLEMSHLMHPWWIKVFIYKKKKYYQPQTFER